jgi:hypothetical protein
MPSEYMTTNVFVGASFMPPSEVHDAVAEGFVSNILWGRDYPHGEGTYKFPDGPGDESNTRRYLRWAFAGCPPDDARLMLGENAIRAFGLDSEVLGAVAARVGPSASEIIAPLTELPAAWEEDVFDFYTGLNGRR